MVFVAFLLAVINAYISTRITTPIEALEKSVNEIEAGNLNADVYVGGSYEIRHLGTSIQNMATQIRRLMDDIVAEHESKRKNESTSYSPRSTRTSFTIRWTSSSG